jgi:dUTP pyrophosphatase
MNTITMLLKIDTSNTIYKSNQTSAYKGDAGFDLFFPNDVIVDGKSTVIIDLELKCCMVDEANVPVSYFIYPRSSIYKTPLRMSNSVGIIDSMYRHNLKVAVDNISDIPYKIEKGTKLFQICAPNLETIRVSLESLSETERGGGFGSSGR